MISRAVVAQHGEEALVSVLSSLLPVVYSCIRQACFVIVAYRTKLPVGKDVVSRGGRWHNGGSDGSEYVLYCTILCSYLSVLQVWQISILAGHQACHKNSNNWTMC